MAAGTNQKSSSRNFYSIGFGKFRQKSLANGQKVDENTPNSVKRVTQQGQESWAIEYDYISGILKSIIYKDNSGTKFENTFEVLLEDKLEGDQISFPEDNKFWFYFAELLPNINLKEPLTITVYDYVNKGNERKSGLTIEQFNNKNTRTVTYKDNTDHNFVKSFYKEYNEETKTWKYLNGYPEPPKEINWKDKDDVKTYFISVKKFFREEIKKYQQLLNSSYVEKTEVIEDSETIDNNENGDLPF